MLDFYLGMLATPEERHKMEIIYHNYYSLMRLVAQQNSQNPSDVDDIVHNSIMKLIKHLNKLDLDDKVAVRAYICTVVANKARDENRRAKPVVDYEAVANQVEESIKDVLEIIQEEEGYQDLLRYIRELSPCLREACDLSLVCGLNGREIAEVLEITESNVTSRICRARLQLKKRILAERKK